MPEPTLIQTDRKAVEPKGLKDAGHTILRCSGCNKPLVDIWRTRPNQIDPRTHKPFEWKFVAQCCYCNDKSYITTVQGGVHIGGYGVDTHDANEAIEKTTIVEQLPMPGREEDVILIKTARCR